MIVIEARDIKRRFKIGREKVDILKGVSLSIERGSFNVLMGPSGSGKTTLLNILGTLDKQDSGSILLEKNDITNMSDHYRDKLRKKKIGFVFQSVALVSNMTAYENIDFALRINGYNSHKRKARAEECLDMVGLKKRMGHKPYELSGGEQQRVAIARAVAHKPVILLADEPTAELDTATGLKIVRLFKDLVERENITVVMCTHDTSMKDIADKVYILEDGGIVSE